MSISCAQAHGKTLEDYMVQHQDKSKNARLKSEEAAFAAWLEELRADQTQFVAEKVLCPSCNKSLCHTNRELPFGVSATTSDFIFESFTPGPCYPPPAFPRAEKEGAKTRQKLVRQLEDRVSLFP